MNLGLGVDRHRVETGLADLGANHGLRLSRSIAEEVEHARLRERPHLGEILGTEVLDDRCADADGLQILLHNQRHRGNDDLEVGHDVQIDVDPVGISGLGQ